ncbi:MAG: NAD(P)-dependent alcohol dehydrogenase [Spirochaetales bacterium]|nr:MAG: NAD(P)-dependent alcohol dehydrogenase [Spirochaetales bacterium]
MKAAVFTEYGPPEVLQLKEVAQPVPKDNEILIRVHATLVSFADTLVRNYEAISPKKFHMPFLFWLGGKFAFGLRKPKITILGSEFSGEVESAGKNVARFKKGDQVFGYCGPRMGADAEYLCLREDGAVAIKPSNMTYEEAAAIPYGAIIALGLLRKTNLRPEQKVLVNGASGGIGSLVVQLAAAHYGAEVTGVCGPPRLEYVKSLGAVKVIDYTKEDFSAGGEAYDLVIDILGKSSSSQVKRTLKPKGRCFLVSFKGKQIFQMLWTSLTGGKKTICVLIKEKAEDLEFIKELIEGGVIKSIIDRRFPLEQAAEAHRYVEQGGKAGSVVLTVKHDDAAVRANHI